MTICNSMLSLVALAWAWWRWATRRRAKRGGYYPSRRALQLTTRLLPYHAMARGGGNQAARAREEGENDASTGVLTSRHQAHAGRSAEGVGERAGRRNEQRASAASRSAYQ